MFHSDKSNDRNKADEGDGDGICWECGIKGEIEQNIAFHEGADHMNSWGKSMRGLASVRAQR